MVDSSYTIDLTGRPPVRRSTSGVLSIDAQRLRSPGRDPNVGPADARNPHDFVALSQYRPGAAPAAWYPHLLKATHDQPASLPAQRLQFFPRKPAAHGYRIQGEPGAQSRPGLMLGGGGPFPVKPPAAPDSFPVQPLHRPRRPVRDGLAAVDAEASERELGGPVAAEWNPLSAGSTLEQ